MNDNDIRKLIDSCTGQIEETGVNSDEVKRLVMAKIGAENKNTAIEDTENDVYAEPVFVSKSSGGNLKFKIAFTAAAAAACVGIAVVGFNFVRGNISDDLLIAGSGKDASFNGTADGEDISLIDNEKGEDVSLLEQNAEAAAQSENFLRVTLLNGIERTYYLNGSCQTIEYDIIDILALGDNELWFIGNGEKINVTKAAGDKSYYIYTYVNENTKREHKVIVGNTTEPAECGYFELYRIDDIEGYEKSHGWQTDGRNCYINSDISSPIAEGYKQWVYDALEELGLTAFDGKASERAGNGEIIDMINAVYITGSPLPIFPISDKDFTLIYEDDIINLTSLDDPLPDYLTLLEEFKLMNGDTIRIALIDEDRLTRPDNNRYTTLVYRNENRNSLFVMENDRIFFIGNNEHIDITDEVGEDKAYIYSYTNPDRNKTHYFAAGGTAESFVYTEIYPVYNEEKNEIMWHSCGVGLDYSYSATNPLMAYVVKQLNQLNIDIYGEYTFDEALDLTVGKSGSKDNFMPSYSDPLPEGYDLAEEITLLNGDKVKLIRSGDNPYNALEYHVTTNDFPIFSLENGRIFFIGNGEHIDITDSVSENSAYTYFYTHPDRNIMHCIVACGTADTFEYAEVYPMDEDENGNLRWNAWAVITPGADYDFLKSAVEGLLINGSVTGISEVMVDAILKNTNEASFGPLPEGVTLQEEFNLLDGAPVRIGIDAKGINWVSLYNTDDIDIFSSENGKLYFIGNGEHEDITDLISEDKTYVYSYIHPERNTVHYIIAGGNIDDFGYAELFTVNEAKRSWYLHGCNCFNVERFELDPGEMTESDYYNEIIELEKLGAYKPWVSDAMAELDIPTPAGGGSEKDFSYLFGSGSLNN
ncbi:MAG: hypothetical protein HDT47_04120 [Ruminococcaceae bacterium]|nr:hypothetical protein [Oscillospiraceae bacterium]